MTTLVVKSDGTKEPYSEDKIRASATRVGVPGDLQLTMLEHIRSRLFDGISTHEIFSMIKEFLHESSIPYLAMKYNLKDALSELGPSGYPFEKYVALLLSDIGYVTQTNITLNGACISHEIDVLAQKDEITYFIEAKFHKNKIQRTDVRVALYIKARYDDLTQAWERGETRSWLITNTRFSKDAIKYGQHHNIRLTSWGYPKGEGIMDLIERTGLHPVTIIDGLTQNDKLCLFSSGIVTCQQLLDPQNQSLISHDLLIHVLPQLTQICQKRI
ncbi:MAG: restriction endonuclease [bacterium]